MRALAGRDVLAREVDAALAQHDALVLPTLPIAGAADRGAHRSQVGTSTEPVRNVMLRLTQLFNVTGHPAISIPAAPSSTGLPCGVQLVGCRQQTDALLKVALACEPQITGGSVAALRRRRRLNIGRRHRDVRRRHRLDVWRRLIDGVGRPREVGL